MVLYVVDLYTVDDHVENINWLQEEIKKLFSMKNSGILSRSLRIEYIFHETRNYYALKEVHNNYIGEIRLVDYNPSVTPMLEGTKLKTNMEQSYVDAKLYRRPVGKLIYCTQYGPNIAYSISIVNRYMNQPQIPHMLAIKRIFRYFKGTNNLGLCYNQRN